MPTSGSYDFNLTRDQIITNAFQRCGVIEEGSTPSVNQVAMAATFLEILLKSLSNEGIGQGFNFSWITVPLPESGSDAVIGDTDSAVYRCILPHLSAAPTRPTSGNRWPIAWVADSSAGAGVVWTSGVIYHTAGAFTIPPGVIGINQAFIHIQGTDRPLDIINSDKYGRILDKAGKGTPQTLHMDKFSGVVYINPQPDKISPEYVLRVQVVLNLEDMDAAGNSSGIPVSGVRMLCCGLAYDLSFPLGLPLNERVIIKNEYFEAKRNFLAHDKEMRGTERMRPGCMVV